MNATNDPDQVLYLLSKSGRITYFKGLRFY